MSRIRVLPDLEQLLGADCFQTGNDEQPAQRVHQSTQRSKEEYS